MVAISKIYGDNDMKITLNEYKANPCGVLSIPYWKNKNIKLPKDMKIVHDANFDNSYLSNYVDEPYFRLIHTLKNVEKTIPNWLYFKTAEDADLDLIVSIINKSYTDLSVDVAQIKSYTKTKVFDKDLWIIVYDKETNTPIGCGIADFDNEVKEGILEWIQVLPEYRGRKVGKSIVNELLYRLKDKSEFVTVSGKVNNETNPERLYRSCGFAGNDVWHILKQK